MEQAACKNHPDVPALWRCTSCEGLFCGLCVNVQMLGPVQANICRSCHGRCESLAAVAEEAAPKKGFFEQVPGAFAFPFKRGGLMLIVIGGLFFWLAGATAGVTFGVIGAVIGGGYLAAYMLRIINHTANGGDELPDWPGFADMWEDIVLPFGLILAVNLFSFAPAIAYFAAGIYYHILNFWIFVALLGLGLFYLPMGLLGAAIYDSVSGLNPVMIIPSIFKTFGAYLVACTVMVLIAVLRGVFSVVLPRIPVLFVGSAIEGILSFYFITVEMRILGLLYRTYEERLGWLKGI